MNKRVGVSEKKPCFHAFGRVTPAESGQHQPRIDCSMPTTIEDRLRGNTIRGNRTESLREENIPPRGSPRGPPKKKPPRRPLLQLNLRYQCTSWRFSEALSETLSAEDFLSETLGPVAPIRVAI